jgi:hypothetical protein
MWPRVIDHLNHDPKDNSWANLRECSNQENYRNKPKHSDNTSGVTGVSWTQERQWSAQIILNKKHKTLYQGNDFFEACCRRKAAEVYYNFHPNHGK